MSMRVFDLAIPGVTIGYGARRQLPELAAAYGRRVGVVTDPGMAAQPSFDECVQLLRDGGMDVTTFTDVVADPPIENVHACVAALRGMDVLVGIGGGSALDITKCAAVLLKHDDPIESMFGIGEVPGRGVATILVPTTAGTGSEVTPIAVLSDHEAHLKRGIVSDHIIADRAVVDPELCLTLPRGPTAYTGMDTFTHAIEALTNKFAVPLIDAFALEAIRLVSVNLKRCVEQGDDVDARYGMSMASLLGGMCLKSVNTAAVHALAYPLGGTFNVPHGIANSLLLPHVIRFNAPVVADRYEQVAKVMGADDVVAAVQQLSAGVGTDRKMREFGVTEADLPTMASSAMQVQRLLQNNPREVTEADALAIYEAAL